MIARKCIVKLAKNGGIVARCNVLLGFRFYFQDSWGREKSSARRWGPRIPRTRQGGVESWSVTGGLRISRPKAGSWLLLEHPFQVCSVGSCVFIARCSHQQRNTQRTKDPWSIHTLNPWRVRKIQFPWTETDAFTELLFPCDREHRFSCQKGSFPPNTCDVFVHAAPTLSWWRVCFSRLRSHSPAFLWPFVLQKDDYSLVWVCLEDHMVSSGWSHSMYCSCKNIYHPCSPWLEGNSPAKRLNFFQVVI